MRQIELAAQALARILGLAKGGHSDQALGLFNEAYQPLLGVGSKVVAALSEEQLVALLEGGPPGSGSRLAAVAELLKVEADLYEREGRPEQSLPRYRRALAVLAKLAADGGQPPDPALAGELADRLAGEPLPPSARLHLARVYEALGRYGDAEDALFEAIEADPDEVATVDAGIAFYQRLLAVDSTRLEDGNLPRAEVEAALAELLRRQLPG